MGTELRCAVIGAGMAGILAAIKLTEAGFTDFTVFEKADRVGGTWRENTYPGLSCDVPSHLYSYSFAPNPDWSHRFSPGSEIQAYFERVADEHDVAARVRFGDAVTRCEFSDGRWQLTTAAGPPRRLRRRHRRHRRAAPPEVSRHRRARHVRGAVFHSARWDPDVQLDGARVGIVGTGSTAVQIVSAIVDRVDALSLFQRTAQWIMPQDNPAYTAEERARRSGTHPDELARAARRSCPTSFDVFANAVVDCRVARDHA